MRTVNATLHTTDQRQSVSFHDDQGVTSDYVTLVSKVMELFPELSVGNFNIELQWTDSNGVVIAAPNEEEAFISPGSLPPDATLNIIIEEVAATRQHNPQSHGTPVCGMCGGMIYGHRYTCTVCWKLDICASCEQKGRHAQHPVTRVTTMHDITQNSGIQRMRLADIGCHRYSPLFDHNTTAPPSSLFNRTQFGSEFFKCRNPTAFQDFHNMAARLTQNWCGSMPPPTKSSPTNEGSEPAKCKQPEAKETKSNGASTGHVYTKSQEYDPKLFTQMVNEMTDNFNETLNKISEKPKVRQDAGLGGKTKPQAPGNGKTCPEFTLKMPELPPSSDFVQMSDILNPMMEILMEAVGGDSRVHGTTGAVDEKQGSCTHHEGDPPGWNSHNHTEGPAPEKSSPNHKEGTPLRVSSLTRCQTSSTVHETKDRNVNQINSTHKKSPQKENGCQCGDPADSKTIHRKSGQCTKPKAGTSREHRSPTPPKVETSQEPQLPTPPKAGTSQELQTSTPPNVRTSREHRSPPPPGKDLASSLAELESMGFKDTNGSLTRLLKAQGNDIWSVLEHILSDGP